MDYFKLSQKIKSQKEQDKPHKESPQDNGDGDDFG
jgi:hypothetical protein